MLEAIIKAENLDVTDEEFNAEVSKVAEAAGKNAEEYRKTMDDRQASYMKNDLLMKKLIAFLKENNTFELKKAEKKTAAKKTAKTAGADKEDKPAAKKTAAKKTTEDKE